MTEPERRPAPRRVLGGRAPDDAAGWPLLDTAASRRLEAETAAALPPGCLMERAGEALARLSRALAPRARRVWVVAGPGHNGGDGLEAAAALQRHGLDVTVSLLPAAVPAAPDVASALARAREAGVRIVGTLDPPDSATGDDLSIDAIFGLGLSRALQGAGLDAVRALRSARSPCLAVDLPSGLQADRGSVLGDAVCARWTLSLLSLKAGLFTAEGRDHSGEVWFDDLGAPQGAAAPIARLLTSARGLRPARLHAQHKGSFGDVWVIGGARGMGGAALLAARAALAGGAGRVYLVALDVDANAVDPLHPELMHRLPESLHGALDVLETATVVCGCGAGDTLQPWMPALASRAARLLLDADALNALAANPALAAPLRSRAARGRETILTPHPLEAARLLGSDVAEVQADRLSAARALASRYRASVVLKGSGTVIAPADARQPPWINASGNAALASAGTGDVLAGWTAGGWAQGLSACQAARWAVHTHGAAADAWRNDGERGAALGASELIDRLRRAPA